MKLRLATALVAVLVLSSTAGQAQLYRSCSKPPEPYCITSSYTYDDDYTFSRCRSDLEFYLQSVDRYTDCLRDQYEREVEEAIQGANQSIDHFNCRARGNTMCF